MRRDLDGLHEEVESRRRLCAGVRGVSPGKSLESQQGFLGEEETLRAPARRECLIWPQGTYGCPRLLAVIVTLDGVGLGRREGVERRLREDVDHEWVRGAWQAGDQETGGDRSHEGGAEKGGASTLAALHGRTSGRWPFTALTIPSPRRGLTMRRHAHAFNDRTR